MSSIIQSIPSTSPDPFRALHLTTFQCLLVAFSARNAFNLSSTGSGPGGTRSVLLIRTSKDAPASFSAFRSSTKIIKVVNRKYENSARDG